MKKVNKMFILVLILMFLLSLGDDSLWSLFFLIFCIYLIYLIYSKFRKKEELQKDIFEETHSSSLSYDHEPYYEIKNYLTPTERLFYHKLCNISENFVIIPQVPLSSIVKKVNGKYQNELNRVIDFGIFDKNFRLLLLVELNDSSHKQLNRRDRDLKVKKILDDCFIKLLTFYTQYPNEQEYINKRIYEALNIIKES